MQKAARQRRATAFGLDPSDALFLPVGIWGVARLTTHGVHGAWDVILAVALGLYAVSLALALVELWRPRSTRDREPAGQDWLLTLFVIALTVLFLTPDGTSDRAIWPWAAVV
ncbi:MAG: hypothetical protein LC808_04420, partial [Actinobacteria bacterium]|nr:hypothetical protein [Actinomycetota bacterium]